MWVSGMVCSSLNESIRLVTRRTSDQARKGKNFQRETYLPGSASCSAVANSRHTPKTTMERAAAATGQAGIAVVIDGPSRRPRRASDLAPRSLHTDAHDSIRREQLGLVGAVGGGCSRRTRARAEMFRTKADPTKRELQDDPAPGRTTKTQDLKDHSHHA